MISEAAVFDAEIGGAPLKIILLIVLNVLSGYIGAIAISKNTYIFFYACVIQQI